MQTKQVVELLKKHLSGDLTAAEAERLSGWIQASEENATLFENLHDPDFLGAQLYRFDSVDTDRGWEKLLSRQKNDIPLRKPAYKWTWAVAAAVVLLSIAVWTLTSENSFYKKCIHKNEARRKTELQVARWFTSDPEQRKHY